MGLSAQHLILLLLVVLLLFGRGKISELMGDVAKGIKSFRKGMSDEDEEKTPPQVPPHTINNEPTEQRDRSKTS